MFYMQIFSFSAGVSPNRYDYIKFLVCLRLTYISLMIHLGEMVQFSKVNQFTWVSQVELTILIHRRVH